MIYRILLIALLCSMVMLNTSTMAQESSSKEPLIFSSDEQEARYTKLTTELRCLVCQNQNLADSDAPLAQDLRQEIYKMMQAGQDDEQIKTFLVDRYGDFVLYRPAIGGNTLALWLMPVLLLAGGAIVVFVSVRRRRMPGNNTEEGTN